MFGEQEVVMEDDRTIVLGHLQKWLSVGSLLKFFIH